MVYFFWYNMVKLEKCRSRRKKKGSNLYVVVHESTGICKVWMFGVDVRQLDSYQVVNLQQNDILK